MQEKNNWSYHYTHYSCYYLKIVVIKACRTILSLKRKIT